MNNRQSGLYTALENEPIDSAVFRIAVAWEHTPPPKAGQFFLIKPKRSSVLLGRPISVARCDGRAVHFLIMKIGSGTGELAETGAGEALFMIGPLGNGWADFLPSVPKNGKPIALVSGGLGCAPLMCFAEELSRSFPSFHFYAGFPTASPRLTGMIAALPTPPQKLIVTTDDGNGGEKGFITDVLDAGAYAAVFSCGPPAMLKTVAAMCGKAGTACFISTENRMACGVGACLGCTVKTASGNKRCCADGPVFNAGEVIFA